MVGTTIITVFTLIQTKEEVVFKVAHEQNYIESGN
jgi:hypothetical protein